MNDLMDTFKPVDPLGAKLVDVDVERSAASRNGVGFVLGAPQETRELVVVGRGEVGKRVHSAIHLSWGRTSD